jgi:Open reading frame 2 N-terminal domain
MNRHPSLFILAMFAGLSFALTWAVAAAQAQQRFGLSSSHNVAITPKVEYSTFPQGDALSINGQAYTVLTDVRAFPASSGQQPSGQVLELKGPYILYRESRPALQSTSARTAVEGSTQPSGQPLLTHAVVLNARTGKVAIVMGTIIVKMTDLSQAGAVAASYGLALAGTFDALGLAYYTVAPGADIAAATTELRTDGRVTSADPEILEHVRVPY